MLTLEHADGLAPTGLIVLGPETPPAEQYVHARQANDLMRQTYEFYMAPPPEGLGLKHNPNTKESHPDPNNEDMNQWVVDRFNTESWRFLGAFALDESGEIPGDDQAMVGMAVIIDGEATELLHWDVRPAYQGKGVGKALLQGGLATVPPDKKLVVDTMLENTAARRIYKTHGFRRFLRGTRKPPAAYFDTYYLRYVAKKASTVQEKLGGLALCQDQLNLMTARENGPSPDFGVLEA